MTWKQTNLYLISKIINLRWCQININVLLLMLVVLWSILLQAVNLFISQKLLHSTKAGTYINSRLPFFSSFFFFFGNMTSCQIFHLIFLFGELNSAQYLVQTLFFLFQTFTSISSHPQLKVHWKQKLGSMKPRETKIFVLGAVIIVLLRYSFILFHLRDLIIYSLSPSLFWSE